MATQNPIEQEGHLPVAPKPSLTGFLMHVVIDYPDAVSERSILQLVRERSNGPQTMTRPPAMVSQETHFSVRGRNS